MKVSEKTKIYSKYISTHFGKIHLNTQDYGIQYTYFRKNYLKHLPKDLHAKILDIGCGMGHFLNFLSVEGYTNSLGIDISEENIEFCKKNNFNVRQADVFSFLKEASDNTYDTIIMNDLIEHLEKQEVLNLLHLIREKLNHGGLLIIKAPNASNPFMAPSSRYLDFTHELLFTEESLSQVLKICGYYKVTIYPQDLYVYNYNPLNYLAKLLNFTLNGLLRLIFYFYARKTTKIFTKNIIAVAAKNQ